MSKFNDKMNTSEGWDSSIKSFKELTELGININNINRSINPRNVEKLQKAFETGKTIPQILVKYPEMMPVDGNHRLKAAINNWKEGKPAVLSVKIYNDGIALGDKTIECAMNTNSQKSSDIIDSMIKNGSVPHMKLLQLCKDYDLHSSGRPALRAVAKVVTPKGYGEYNKPSYNYTEKEYENAKTVISSYLSFINLLKDKNDQICIELNPGLAVWAKNPIYKNLNLEKLAKAFSTKHTSLSYRNQSAFENDMTLAVDHYNTYKKTA